MLLHLILMRDDFENINLDFASFFKGRVLGLTYEFQWSTSSVHVIL